MCVGEANETMKFMLLLLDSARGEEGVRTVCCAVGSIVMDMLVFEL